MYLTLPMRVSVFCVHACAIVQLYKCTYVGMGGARGRPAVQRAGGRRDRRRPDPAEDRRRGAAAHTRAEGRGRGGWGPASAGRCGCAPSAGALAGWNGRGDRKVLGREGGGPSGLRVGEQAARGIRRAFR